MIINPKYKYEKVNRVTNPDGTRFYTCPVYGTPLPSVTTILSATADKTALILWEEAVGKAKADRVRAEACNLGTLMHTNLENHINGLPHEPGSHPIRLQAARMADVIIAKGFPKIDEVWAQEVAMYYPGLYAGMTDLIGVHEGRSAILDHKTTRKMKSPDQIDDYRAQVAAYALASDTIHGTQIERAVIFMVSRDLKYAEFIIDRDELERQKEKFLERLVQYQTVAAAA